MLGAVTLIAVALNCVISAIPISVAKGVTPASGDLATLNIETTEKGIVPSSIDDSLRAKLDRLCLMATKLNDVRGHVTELTAKARRSPQAAPSEAKESFPPEPLTALTASQKKLYGIVLATPDGIQLAQIELRLPELRRSELYYRLECLVLTGLLEKKQNTEHTIGIPCITYKPTSKSL